MTADACQSREGVSPVKIYPSTNTPQPPSLPHSQKITCKPAGHDILFEILIQSQITKFIVSTSLKLTLVPEEEQIKSATEVLVKVMVSPHQ